MNDDSVFGPVLSSTATYAQRQACRRALNLPGRVDRWLTSNMRTTRIAGFADYMMLDDVNGADCVVCTVELVCVKVRTRCHTSATQFTHYVYQGLRNLDQFAQPDLYTLYLTAVAPPRTRSSQRSSTSPRATLDRFLGSKSAIDAPEWAQWTASTTTFQQPRASFATLFTRMAMWPVNASEVCTSLFVYVLFWLTQRVC